MFIHLALHMIAKTLNISSMNKLLLLILIIPSYLLASESTINESWCASMGGESEFRTKDGTYVDCLTDELAIEAEYDYNWKEAIGQSLHYAESSNRAAGILFIKRAKSKKDYRSELLRVINKYNLPIEVFFVEE
ncbi:hypothetical protein OAC39_00165 [Gammaproteobacteria bacterium]|nr:hypothetical protein [Gammaproteobacteria bacterium]